RGPGQPPNKMLKSFLLTAKLCLLENPRMSRLLKALPLALATAALSVFASGCGSSNPAQVRLVHVIQDAPGPLDIDVSTPNVTTPQEFLDIPFLGVLPNQPGYTSTPSGSATITGF